MPCYDSRSNPNSETIWNLSVRLDRVTAAACELAGFYRQAKLIVPGFRLSPETEKWMKEHEEWDKARKEGRTNRLIGKREMEKQILRKKRR